MKIIVVVRNLYVVHIKYKMAQTLYSVRIPDNRMPSTFSLWRNEAPIPSISISTRSSSKGTIVSDMENELFKREDAEKLANVVVNCNRPVMNKVYENDKQQKTIYACPVRKKGDKKTCYGVLISESRNNNETIKHRLSDHLEQESGSDSE